MYSSAAQLHRKQANDLPQITFFFFFQEIKTYRELQEGSLMIDYSGVSWIFSTITTTVQYERKERPLIRFDLFIQKFLQEAARMFFVCEKY